MNPAALVFLDNPRAMRLAAVWSYLTEEQREDNDAWCKAAGVDFRGASLIGALRQSGICRDDGTTDELALQYIAAKMTKGMKRAPKPQG